MSMERDCKHCIHLIPVYDDSEGTFVGADCESWDCEYINRKEALKAYKDAKGESQ